MRSLSRINTLQSIVNFSLLIAHGSSDPHTRAHWFHRADRVKALLTRLGVDWT